MNFQNTTARYDGINERGIAGLRQATARTFTGFPQTLKYKFCVAMLFNAAASLFASRLTQLLADIETHESLRMFLGGRDYKTHSTVLEGQGEAGQVGVIEILKRNAGIQKVSQSLNCVEISYDRVLVDGANVILAASVIPERVLLARQTLADIYSRHGMKPLPMIDILHCTLLRLMTLPAGHGALESYIGSLARIQEDIAAKPLTVEVDSIFTGVTSDILGVWP